jgi:hypothetical protein
MKNLVTWILFGAAAFVIYVRFLKPKTQAQVDAQDQADLAYNGNLAASRSQAAMPPFATIGRQPLSGASIVATAPQDSKDFILELFPTLLGNARQTISFN